ncbi:MAG: hypothetical protein HY698_06595 [Deltaproteobacteria bacterium]|nr:hypothetical protein [Deltaproteobacteria bacterium]
MMLTLAWPSAWAYDFEVESTTVGQGYQLRWFRRGQDVFLNRRRLSQSLRLHVWNILEPSGEPADDRREAPFELYFTSSMRLDHDFGEVTQGDVAYGAGSQREVEPARDVVPELDNSHLALDVLHAYLGARGILGFLDLELGRSLVVDSLDWFSFDGARARVRTPWHLSFDGLLGLVVRERGPASSPTHEPDGSSSAECAEFDEIRGTWVASRECAQRDELMPTIGVGIETDGWRWASARLFYRRTVSPTVEGLYPDSGDQAPDWGVNEEHLSAMVRGHLADGRASPWMAARWNFLLAQLDEAHAGLRLAAAEHALTAEYSYSFPSFEGDSIFNVFSIEPYHDVRLSYDIWPGRGAWRSHARAFVRRFENTDLQALEAGELQDESDTSKGVAAGVQFRGFKGRARASLFYETGHGGVRAGGDASTWFRPGERLELEGRISVIHFDEDLREELQGTSLGLQGGGRWILTDGVALHLILEENVSRLSPGQFRVVGILDLAFQPEI